MVVPEVERAKRLRNARRYDDSRAVIEQALGDPGCPPDVAAELHSLRGLIHDDYGRYAKAADDFGRAADLATDPADVACWRAVELERRFRGRASTDAEIRAEARTRLDALIEAADGRPDEQTHLLWARARILGGVHPDDQSSREALDRAQLDIDRSLALGHNPLSLQVTRARHARINAANAEDREDALAAARQQLTEARAAIGESNGQSRLLQDPLVLLDFELARLEITARRWDVAIEILERVVKRSVPPHHAAQVWLIYCKRVLGRQYEDLQRQIEELLDDGPDGGPPPVTNVILRAQLYTERAALRESRDPAEALADYERALAIRPDMSFALRGVLRCKAMTNDLGSALAMAQELYDGLENDEVINPSIAVEIAELWLSAPAEQDSDGVGERETPAFELFDRAIAASPAYGYAYERKVAALRSRDRWREAIRVGVLVLREREGQAWGLGGLRIELGHCYLAAGRPNSAIAQFAVAESDPAPAVHQRARAGRINALLWKRDLEGARMLAAEAADGSREIDAAGWFYGVSGCYGMALDRFARAHARRPFEPSPIIGEARVLRLLARPAEASRRLRRVLERWPDHNTSLIHNEMGWAAIDERRYDDALKHFDEVLRRSPRAQGALRGRISAIARLDGRRLGLDRAIAHALDHAGSAPRARAATLTESGMAMLHVKDHLRARAFFFEANALSASVSQRLLQGHALLWAGLITDAERCAEDAAAIGPRLSSSDADVLEILDELGLAVAELGPVIINGDRSSIDILLDELGASAAGAEAALAVRTAWEETERGGSAEALLSVIGEHRARAQRAGSSVVEGAFPLRDPDVLLLRGACLLARGHRIQALTLFRDATRICGEGTIPAPIAQSVALTQAREHDAAGTLLAALSNGGTGDGSVRAAELEAWCRLELDPDSQRGGAGVEGRREIVAACMAIVEQEPSRVDAYVCLAALSARDEHLPEALSFLEQAAAVAPGAPDVLREKAALLLRAGDIKGCLAGTAELLKQAPQDGRGHLIAGLAHLEHDDLAQAVMALRAAHAQGPQDADAVRGLVTALGRSGHDDEALEILDRALRFRHRESHALHLARARTLHTMARERADALGEAHLVQALRDANRAFKLAHTPNEEADANYHCGVILLAQRYPRTAVKSLDAALGSNPHHRGAMQARAITREAGADAANARLLRRAAYAVGGLSCFLLFLVLVASAVAMVSAPPADFSWTPISFVVFGLLAAIAAAGVLPRIAGVKLRQIEITITAPPPPSGESTPTPFDFGRLPLATLSGPSTYRITEVVPDLSGVPETV